MTALDVISAKRNDFCDENSLLVVTNVALAIEKAFAAEAKHDYVAGREWFARARQIANANESAPDHFSLAIALQAAPSFESAETLDPMVHEHLERSAALGYPQAQMLLAHWYHHGLNGLKKSEANFLRWIVPAVESGEQLALCEYVGYLLDKKQGVSNEYREKIDRLAAEFSEAKRVKQRLDRQIKSNNQRG
jgi:TPR repeat protein